VDNTTLFIEYRFVFFSQNKETTNAKTDRHRRMPLPHKAKGKLINIDRDAQAIICM
jgi:hypothetical protein